MPTSAPRACSVQGCSNYANRAGKCKNHSLAQEQRRGTSTERGYDKHWRILRDLVIQEQPICQHCLCHGIYVPAQEVDHIVPISKAPHRRLDRSNLQALCKPCHTRKTRIESIGQEDVEGWGKYL